VTPLLRTPRLVLRPFAAGDLDDLFAMDGDDRVMRYLGSGLTGRTREQCARTLAAMVERAVAQPGRGLLHASRADDGTFVGGCGLFPLPESEDIEIAYRLPFVRWGQGYATEMARAVRDHGFAALGLGRIVGVTWPQNVPSQRVLEKAGFVAHGEAMHYGVAMRAFLATKAAWRPEPAA